MLKYSFLFIALFSINLGFSQSEKVLIGKIVSQNSSVSNVEIINNRSKNVAVSNEFGVFEISIKPNDMLILIAKNYYEKKFVVSPKVLLEKQLIISLDPKENELKEVVVEGQKQLVPKVEMDELQRLNETVSTNLANSSGVYTGETINGMNLIAVGKLIASAFKSKNKKSQKTGKIDFKDYINRNLNESFFYDKLQIKPIDFPRYLDFCDADPSSQDIIRENNEFNVLNFLIEKKIAFDKL